MKSQLYLDSQFSRAQYAYDNMDPPEFDDEEEEEPEECEDPTGDCRHEDGFMCGACEMAGRDPYKTLGPYKKETRNAK